MVYIDIHSHLDFEDFDSDREDLVQEFKQNDIKVISNTLNWENYLHTKDLFSNAPNIQVSPGLYPQEAEKLNDDEMEEYLSFLRKERDNYICIGEVGMDGAHTKEEDLLDLQEKRFRQIIELAIELNKPLIIHSRKVEGRVIEILREYIEERGFRKFVFHCFTGRKKFIKEIRDLKLFASVPLTVLNTESFQILVEVLPVHQLLVETDSPFLNPRKERNTPLNIIEIYDKISEIKKLDKLEVKNIIFNNYTKLFIR